jgi:hypothetical protein
MKGIEKNKAQKLIDKIQCGQFDENDIDNLLMRLRAYSSGFPIFREIADFVAHNDQRDRGVINQSLETMYLRMKFFLEYNSPKKSLDLSKPFPSWIKRLMKYQVDKCNEKDLIQKFNVRKERLKSRIDNGFKDNKSTNTTSLKDGKLSQDTVSAIQHVMSFISGNATFTQTEFIADFCKVIEENKGSFAFKLKTSD